MLRLRQKAARLLSLGMAVLLIISSCVTAIPTPARAETTISVEVSGAVYDDANGVFEINGNGFEVGDTFDLSKIIITDRLNHSSEVKTYTFVDGDANVNILNTSEVIFQLTPQGVNNLCVQIPRIYDGNDDTTVSMKFAKGWYLGEGLTAGEEENLGVYVKEAYPVGQEIENVRLASDKGIFTFLGNSFNVNERIDVTHLTFYDQNVMTEEGEYQTYTLSAEDATAQIISENAFVVNLTSTGRENLRAVIPQFDQALSDVALTMEAHRDYYRGANGEYRNEEERAYDVIDVDVLPEVTMTDSDLDKVYYYRLPDSGLASDELKFELKNLPSDIPDFKVMFGYLEDEEFIATEVVNGNIPLNGENKGNGSYQFSSPISTDYNNNNLPLAVQMYSGEEAVGVPFELPVDDRLVYVNIMLPEFMLVPGSATTDITAPGIDLHNLNNFTLHNPGFAKIVFRGPVNFADHMQQLIYLGDYLYLDSNEYVGLKHGRGIYDNVPVSVYMENITLGATPKIRSLLYPGHPVNQGLTEVSNILYDPQTLTLSFDAQHIDLFEPYFPANLEFEDIDPDKGQVGGIVTWQVDYLAPNVSGFDLYYLDSEGQRQDPLGDMVTTDQEYSIEIALDTEIDDTMKDIALYGVSEDSEILLARLPIIDKVQITADTSNIVIDGNTSTETVIKVPVGVTNATVDMTTLVQPKGETKEAVLNYPLKAQLETNTSEMIALEVPANVAISAPAEWTGVLNLPTILPNTQVSVDNGTVATVIEVGAGDLPLTLSKAAKLVFPGQAGKRVGFQRDGKFTEITQVLERNTQQWADEHIGTGEDAKIEVGEDLIVWTKHFTKFATYTVTNAPGNDNGNNNGSSGTTSSTTPVVSPPQAGKAFLDLANHWAEADIQVLVNKGIIKGQSENVFAPEQKITRAELIAILVRGLNLKATSTMSLPKDVPSNAWYAESIQAAINAGLITGYNDGNIRPHAYISREEMSVLLARASKLLNLTMEEQQTEFTSQTFVDSQNISTWAKASVEAAVKAELIKGTSTGHFLPGKTATRAEAAVMVKRLLQKGKLI